MMKKNVIALMCMFLATSFWGEDFRVREVVFASYDEAAQLKLNDGLAVSLPEDRTFLKGMEVDVAIPPEIAGFPGTAGYSVYGALTPAPAPGRIDYSGERLAFDVFPARSGLLLGVPYGSGGALKTSPYIRLLPVVLTENTEALFFRIHLVMKGVTEEVLQSRFQVTVRPVFANKGRLLLRVAFPAEGEGKPYTVFIDENALEAPPEGIILDSGIHHLSIVSDFYRNETRTFTIPRGQTIPLEVALQDIAPTMLITAPAGSEVLLDGERIPFPLPVKPFPITPGDHTVKFSFGGYETLQTINAVNGKSYTMALSLEVKVLETP
ncbi:MAG: hypothetical protein LBR23_09440 [Spirochaetaceae bacterium]|jgi:hypothetical protein|nr:hypothetical protein [Spirochaetaceae bacterium]